jgi:hypothetical protein
MNANEKARQLLKKAYQAADSRRLTLIKQLLVPALDEPFLALTVIWIEDLVESSRPKT